MRQQLQENIDRSQTLVDEWEREIKDDLARADKHLKTLRKCEKRARLGWKLTLVGGGVLAAGLVVGLCTGAGTLGALPGIAVTFTGLGLAQFSDMNATSARMEYQMAYPDAMKKRQLLDSKVYPRLEQARAALQAEEGRQLQEMQALADGLRSWARSTTGAPPWWWGEPCCARIDSRLGPGAVTGGCHPSQKFPQVRSRSHLWAIMRAMEWKSPATDLMTLLERMCRDGRCRQALAAARGVHELELREVEMRQLLRLALQVGDAGHVLHWSLCLAERYCDDPGHHDVAQALIDRLTPDGSALTPEQRFRCRLVCATLRLASGRRVDGIGLLSELERGPMTAARRQMIDRVARRYQVPPWP